MSKGFAKELIALLKTAGCHEVRKGKGNHVIWYSPITRTTFPVDQSVKSRHTANITLKQAGLPKAF
jgi:predicted RNA binding protein YcfA (HicA-like mRNA interferase family)